jgi:hypothetical protein
MTKIACTPLLCHFSLSNITCSGSLGMISARYLEHPLRQCKCKSKIKIKTKRNFFLPIPLFWFSVLFYLRDIFLSLIRFLITPLGTLVALRSLGTSNNLQKALGNDLLVLSWLRSSSQFKIKTKSVVSLFEIFCSNSAFVPQIALANFLNQMTILL